MTIIEALIRLRDDLKTWVANNISAKTEPISAEVDILNELVGDTSVADQISAALDTYTPDEIEYGDIVGAPNIMEDGSGEILIQDNSGNVIMKVDEGGVHTTAVSLNGVDVGSALDSAISDIGAVSDLVGDTAVSTQIKNAIEEITFDSIPGAPSITEDGSGQILVQDESGNVILKVDEGGVHTTAVSLNGADVQTAIDGVAEDLADVSELVGDTAVSTQIKNAVDEIEYGDLPGAPNIMEDGSGEISVQDGSGNVILLVDENGIHTTAVDLNGMDVQAALDSASEHYIANNPHGLDYEDVGADQIGSAATALVDAKAYTDGREAAINAAIKSGDDSVLAIVTAHTTNNGNPHGVNAEQIGAATKAELSVHTDNPDIHVQDGERAKWNAKSDFSGSYKDLTDTPNISDDGTGTLYVQDGSGNIIFAVDENGIGTTAISLNGNDVETMINMKADDVALGEHMRDDSNPHNVTYSQVGADREGSAAKALTDSKAYVAERETVINKAISDGDSAVAASITTHTDKKDNPHEVTYLQVGADKEGSAAQALTDAKSYIDTRETAIDGKITAGDEAVTAIISAHTTRVDNPHEVTAAQVKADPEGSADAALTAAKEYTDEREEAIDGKISAGDKVVSDALGVHVDNPDIHIRDGERELWTNKSDFSGSYKDLTDMPNISDDSSGDFTIQDSTGNVIMAVSQDGVTAYAYRTKDGADLESLIELSMENHMIAENPHGITPVLIGAATADDLRATNDALALKADTSYVQELIDGMTAEGDANAGVVQANLNLHLNDKSNPHGVTAAQVGAPTTTEFGTLQTTVSNHMGDKSNPHGVTAEQVGADPSGTAEAVLGAHTLSTNPHGVTCDMIGAAPVANGVYCVTTEGDGLDYTATVPNITELVAGVSFIMIPHVNSASTMPTLDVNGLGSKGIARRGCTNTGARLAGAIDNWLINGRPVRVVYDGSRWIVEGMTKPVASDLVGQVGIAQGGTGATDAATALANLGAIPTSQLGVPNGVASLAEDGKVPESQLPDFNALPAEFAEPLGLGESATISDAIGALTQSNQLAMDAITGGLTVEYRTYIGDGTYGESSPLHIECGGEPILFYISRDGGGIVDSTSYVHSMKGLSNCAMGTTSNGCALTWGSSYFKMSGNSASNQMNADGVQYHMAVAFRPKLFDGAVTLTALLPDGTPAANCKVDGIYNAIGASLTTDQNGTVSGFSVSGSQVTVYNTEYIDLANISFTLPELSSKMTTLTYTFESITKGSVVSLLKSKDIKFAIDRTIEVALVGGGNGGSYGGYAEDYSTEGYGGHGGLGGNVYNTSTTVSSAATYTVLIGAGGVGGIAGAYEYKATAPTAGGNTTAFGLTSESGSYDTLVFNDSSILAGGQGGQGSKGSTPVGPVYAGAEGYAGTRCGGKGGSAGKPGVSGGGYGGTGYDGAKPGGGGGGGAGQAYRGTQSAAATYPGHGGDGASGGLFIKF